MNLSSLCLQLPSNSAISINKKSPFCYALIVVASEEELSPQSCTWTTFPTIMALGSLLHLLALLRAASIPATRQSQTTFQCGCQGGTAPAAHYKTSASCIKMETKQCRMQQMLFYLRQMLMLSPLSYHVATPNQFQEGGNPAILRKAQMTPEWEALAAALAPLWTADSFYPLGFKRNGGIFVLESD